MIEARGDRAWQEHWEQCTECVKVTDRAHIIITDDERRRARKGPVFKGLIQEAGCPTHQQYYVAKCWRCDACFVDYPGGYTDGGRLKLRCSSCRAVLPLEDPEVYWRLGFGAPPTLMQEMADRIRIFRGGRPRYDDGRPAPKDWKG